MSDNFDIFEYGNSPCHIMSIMNITEKYSSRQATLSFWSQQPFDVLGNIRYCACADNFRAAKLFDRHCKYDCSGLFHHSCFMHMFFIVNFGLRLYVVLRLEIHSYIKNRPLVIKAKPILQVIHVLLISSVNLACYTDFDNIAM